MKKIIFSLLVQFLYSLAVLGAENSTELVINIPALEVTLLHEGKIVDQFPLAVGSPVYKTPIGDRFLKQIVWNPWWFPPDSPWARGAKPTPPGPANPLGPVKMNLGGDIRMHGTNKEASIGSAVSHGCMRMKNNDAKRLARWIQEYHTDQTDPLLFEQYAKEKGRSFYVNLDEPIPVKIVYDLVEREGDFLKTHRDIYGKSAGVGKAVADFLQTHGFDEEKINPSAMGRLLQKAQTGSGLASFRELFPGNFLPNPAPPLDPVEEGWIAHLNEPPRRNFSFLLNFPSL